MAERDSDEATAHLTSRGTLLLRQSSYAAPGYSSDKNFLIKNYCSFTIEYQSGSGRGNPSGNNLMVSTSLCVPHPAWFSAEEDPA